MNCSGEDTEVQGQGKSFVNFTVFGVSAICGLLINTVYSRIFGNKKLVIQTTKWDLSSIMVHYSNKRELILALVCLQE